MMQNKRYVSLFPSYNYFISSFYPDYLHFSKILPEWELFHIDICLGKFPITRRIKCFTVILQFTSVLEVIFFELYSTPFGIALKIYFVWLLYLFIYLSILFFLWWTWIFNLPLSSQNNFRPRKGNILSIIIETLFISFKYEQPPGLQVSHLNCK